MSKERKIEVEKMFNQMDPNGNGYVEQPEFASFLHEYGIHFDHERSLYLFKLIESLNSEYYERGSCQNGIRIQY